MTYLSTAEIKSEEDFFLLYVVFSFQFIVLCECNQV